MNYGTHGSPNYHIVQDLDELVNLRHKTYISEHLGRTDTTWDLITPMVGFSMDTGTYSTCIIVLENENLQCILNLKTNAGTFICQATI